MDGLAAGKVSDFAGEADAAELRDFVPVNRIALVAALTHKALMRVRDDLATKIKKAKAELEEIRLSEREIVESLIGNYRTIHQRTIDQRIQTSGRPRRCQPALLPQSLVPPSLCGLVRRTLGSRPGDQ